MTTTDRQRPFFRNMYRDLDPIRKWRKRHSKMDTSDKIDKIILTAFIAIVLLGGSIAGVGCVHGCDRDYSNGERTGYVVKLSHKGYIIKSWEGSMHLAGGNNGGGGSGSDTWTFSVSDDSLVEKIKNAQENGVRVTLSYSQWLVHPVRIDTDYEITNVK